VIGDVSSRTEGSAFIRAAVERVLANAIAGVGHGVYGHLDWLADQLYPTTCDIDGLSAWGSMLKLDRKAAAKAVGPATFTGTDGTQIVTNTQLRTSDGLTFTVIVGGTIASGSMSITVEANTGGVAGNLEAGARISLASPIAGIDTDGTVTSPGLSGGTDIEDPEDYRARILENLRIPPSGGGPGDYETWAKQVTGVTRAWEFGNRMGLGTVSLAFTMDDRADPIPLSGDVADVQAYIDSVKPIDMRAAYVVAPVGIPVNMTIALSPNTLAVQEAVTAELQELFKTEADLETPLALSKIGEAISTATGENAHQINAISSLAPGVWGLLVLGNLTFASL
jgi:uncharacterized phage protein gp47/JayE